MLDALARLLDHMAWSDERVGLAVEAGSSERARELYAHVLGAEQIWLARIRGQPDGPVWPVWDREEIRRMSSSVVSGYRDLLQEITNVDLDRIIAYRNSAGQPFESRVADILLHVFLHGAYHRGQIALLLRDGGDDPAPSDFIAFVRGAAAATRDDAERRRPRGG